jgi:propionyl-CoA carboxylase alpha chain
LARPGNERVVVIGEKRWTFAVADKDGEFWLTDGDGVVTLVEMHWAPGDTLARVRVDGEVIRLKVQRRTGGFRIRHRGADLIVKVLEPLVAALLELMPVKVPPDLSRFLMCPMPGQVVRIDVAAGDVVEDGQILAVVEAMKMENVLKAQKRARVAKVHVAAGAVLAVDQIIMEFEGV